MSEPFSGTVEFEGRTFSTKQRVKLDAAKEQLRLHRKSLGAGTELVLVGFNAQASVLFEGDASDAAGIDAVLESIHAGGGTNVAAALDRATEVALQRRALIVRVLVISDGLSNADTAVPAAQRLAAVRATIDVLLIDPTPDGSALARAIAIEGRVTGVTTEAQLADQMAMHARIEQELRSVARRVESELTHIAREQPAADRVRFTAGHPSIIGTADWSPLHVFVHVARLELEVQRKLAEMLRTPFRTVAAAESAQALPQDVMLRIAPRANGVEFNPVAQEIVWSHDLQQVAFHMRGRPEAVGSVATGAIEVTHQSLLVATIPLTMSVGTDGAPEHVEQRGRLIEEVFASYSHEDTDLVQACAAAYRALGIYVHVDVSSLMSGEAWEVALKTFIRRSNLFQLFWSTSASRSPNVEAEWRYALSLLAEKSEGFIRPVRWEEKWPDPPDPLRRFHFAPLDLRALPLPPGAAPRPPADDVTAAVVPLLGGTSDLELTALEREAAAAVRFLEETTGLRYYPVPTLLVDEHTVRSVRPEDAPIRPPADAPRAWNAILRALAVHYHVSARGSRAAGMAPDAAEKFRHACEAAIANIVEEAIGSDVTDGDVRAALARIDAICAAAVERNRPDEQFIMTSRSAPEAEAILRRRNVRVENHHNTYLTGSSTAFASALRDLRPHFARLATRFRNIDTNAAQAAIVLSDLDAAMLRTILFVASSLADKFAHRLPKELEQFEMVVSPRWRELREEFAAVGVPGVERTMTRIAFVQRLAELMKASFSECFGMVNDSEYRCGYRVDAAVWSRIGAEVESLGVRGEIEAGFGDRINRYLTGPFSAATALLEHAWDEVLRALITRPAATRIERYFAEEVATYGIYVPASAGATDNALRRWAAERGFAAELTLPARRRVVFCANARERFEETLVAENGPLATNERLAREFVRCVLVHEHFHAIADRGAGDGAHVLNESLATWMELHAVRGDEEMTRLVWQYIRRDHIDAWPYAGAEIIEEVYQREGLEAVRKWVRVLRDEPRDAEYAFDIKRVAGPTPPVRSGDRS